MPGQAQGDKSQAGSSGMSPNPILQVHAEDRTPRRDRQLWKLKQDLGMSAGGFRQAWQSRSRGSCSPPHPGVPKPPGLLLTGLWCLPKEGGAGDDEEMEDAKGSRAAQPGVGGTQPFPGSWQGSGCAKEEAGAPFSWIIHFLKSIFQPDPLQEPRLGWGGHTGVGTAQEPNPASLAVEGSRSTRQSYSSRVLLGRDP